MSRRLIGTLAAGALAAAMLGAAGAASAAVTPKTGTYISAGSGSSSKMTIEVVERRGALRVRLLEIKDDCASSFVLTPIALGKAKGRFHDEYEGHTNTVGYRAVFDGRFTRPNRATITVQSSVGDLFPPTGTPPGSANQCSDTTSFGLKFLPDGL